MPVVPIVAVEIKPTVVPNRILDMIIISTYVSRDMCKPNPHIMIP
jgi:hypothetical protein